MTPNERIAVVQKLLGQHIKINPSNIDVQRIVFREFDGRVHYELHHEVIGLPAKAVVMIPLENDLDDALVQATNVILFDTAYSPDGMYFDTNENEHVE